MSSSMSYYSDQNTEGFLISHASERGVSKSNLVRGILSEFCAENEELVCAFELISNKKKFTTIACPPEFRERVDRLVALNLFTSRSEFIRLAFLNALRRHFVDDTYILPIEPVKERPGIHGNPFYVPEVELL